MIERRLKQDIQRLVGGRKAIVILGARQVGKSTFLQDLFKDAQDVLWLNGDEQNVVDLLSTASTARLSAVIGNNRLLIIDEAQKIPDIGQKIKLITDGIDSVQVVATGSSSFELTSKVNESLAGRKREFKMFPLTFGEIVSHTSLLSELDMIPHRLIYGYYPEVVTSPGEEKTVLKELTDSYLYRDIMSLEGIHKPDKLVRLLKALALQIGSQVSYHEIAQLIGMDSKTVEKYVDILEKSFIVFRLGSFARNLRNELKSSRKIYFWDTGVRNAVIGNFSTLENRSDTGALWENFVVSERMKINAYRQDFTNCYFWRTQQQKEIDLIEERDGELHAYEIKWNANKKNAKLPEQFAKAYPDATYTVITPENIEQLIG